MMKVTLNTEKVECDSTLDEQPGHIPFNYSFEEFKNDLCWIFYLQAEMIFAMTDAESALRFLGKQEVTGFIDFDPACIPPELRFSYKDIRHTPFARSLEAMYRYAYHGEEDASIEPLGPGGYHIIMAAIINDLAKSSLVSFWMHIDGQGRQSVMNCLRTAELANARLVLEGKERFFNFEGGDDYDSLAITERNEPPQGGYGKAVTIRQMALLADMGEPTIRTAANPKRARHIPTYSHNGRTVIAIQDAKDWLQEKGRYIPIKSGSDVYALDLAERRFTSTGDLWNVLFSRLIALDSDPTRKPEHRAAFQKLSEQYDFNGKNMSALSTPDFINRLSELLSFPPRLFALRVEEVLLEEKLNALREKVRITVQESSC